MTHGPVCIGLDNGCPDCKALQEQRQPRPEAYAATLLGNERAAARADILLALAERLDALQTDIESLAVSVRELRAALGIARRPIAGGPIIDATPHE